MNYNQVIEKAFLNILDICNKLGTEKYFVKKNIRIITDHINRLEEKIRGLSERLSGVKQGGYDDALEFFSYLIQLHGWNETEINNTKFKDFVIWYKDKALNNPAYRAERINKFILKAFLDGYCLFCIEYSREPDTYEELKGFVFNWEDIIDSKAKKEIDKLTEQINSLKNAVTV